jgi:DNA-directed RNA polymerase specialized sigma24 family protein
VKNFDRTNVGGSRSRFETTQWAEMRAFAGLDESQRRVVLDGLIDKYWKPVYCYLRRKGYDNERAKDLTQGFFHEIVMGCRLIEKADESKGRFRTFLLTALNRYVVSTHRHQTAGKRRPAGGVAALHETAETTLSRASEDMGPDEAFTYTWAIELLQEVLAELKEQCRHDGKEVHWHLFQARVLDPILGRQEPPALSQLCEQFNVASPVKAENMIVTVKRRFQAAMRSRVREYVASDGDVEQEICDLMTILSR